MPMSIVPKIALGGTTVSVIAAATAAGCTHAGFIPVAVQAPLANIAATLSSTVGFAVPPAAIVGVAVLITGLALTLAVMLVVAKIKAKYFPPKKPVQTPPPLEQLEYVEEIDPRMACAYTGFSEGFSAQPAAGCAETERGNITPAAAFKRAIRLVPKKNGQ